VRLRPTIAALRSRRRPVLLGSLGTTTPVSARWGYDRGTPVDRWYIERFLERERAAIRGRVLEVKDSGYTDRFGREVTETAVLDVDPGNERATIVADLSAAEGIPDGSFDCFVCTQTLHYVWEVRAAVAHARRILAPGGVLLATLPVTSRVPEPPVDFWRFTPTAVHRLFEEAFARDELRIEAVGNVLAQVAFLEGMAAEELQEHELVEVDPRFPLLVCVRAERRS
jgi:SAM-dependent methyltransferase